MKSWEPSTPDRYRAPWAVPHKGGSLESQKQGSKDKGGGDFVVFPIKVWAKTQSDTVGAWLSQGKVSSLSFPLYSSDSKGGGALALVGSEVSAVSEVRHSLIHQHFLSLHSTLQCRYQQALKSMRWYFKLSSLQTCGGFHLHASKCIRDPEIFTNSQAAVLWSFPHSCGTKPYHILMMNHITTFL